MTGYVYAIQADDGLVKIGFTTNLRGRLSYLRANNARQLHPVGAIKATQEQEAALHSLLQHECVRGEWFHRGRLTAHFLNRLPAWPVRDVSRPRRPGKTITPHPWCVEIEKAIRESGMSMRAISLEIGAGPNAVQQMLREGKKPSFDRLIAICDAIGLDPEKVRAFMEERRAKLREDAA